MATDALTQLVQALEAHTAELEIERDLAPDWGGGSWTGASGLLRCF
jgi:hypothetical protein